MHNYSSICASLVSLFVFIHNVVRVIYSTSQSALQSVCIYLPLFSGRHGTSCFCGHSRTTLKSPPLVCMVCMCVSAYVCVCVCVCVCVSAYVCVHACMLFCVCLQPCRRWHARSNDSNAHTSVLAVMYVLTASGNFM